MLKRPLANDQSRRMVHRGLPGATTPMLQLGWPVRGVAATIPVSRSLAAENAAFGRAS
jgi:hypothetical protein